MRKIYKMLVSLSIRRFDNKSAISDHLSGLQMTTLNWQLAFDILLLASLLMIAILVHTIGVIISAIGLKLRIKEIRVFYGKPILRLKFQGFSLSVGFIPMGGHVKYHDEELNETGLSKKLLMALGGPTTLIILGSFFLGYEYFVNSFFAAFKQILLGAYRPFIFGEEYCRQLLAILDYQPREIVVGVFVTKCAAFNLQPIPPLNGGFVITHWLISSNRTALAMIIAQIGMLFCLSIWVGWIIAFGAHLY